jgi:hypothetical protein
VDGYSTGMECAAENNARGSQHTCFSKLRNAMISIAILLMEWRLGSTTGSARGRLKQFAS